MMNTISDPRDLLACGQVQEALRAAEAALKIDSNNADIYNIAGICAITLGNRELAEHYWRQTIRLDPKASGACFNLGLLCARSQRDEAEQCYRKAIALAPNALSKSRLLFRVPFHFVADEQFVQNKFQELAGELQTLDDKASISELDAVIDRHIKF